MNSTRDKSGRVRSPAINTGSLRRSTPTKRSCLVRVRSACQSLRSTRESVPKVAGMIWQDDLKHQSNRAKTRARLEGVAFTLMVVGFVVFWVVQGTGGIHGSCP